MQDNIWQPLQDPLTARELEILRHVAAGASDRDIAEALFLSLNTIKWHNRRIYSKLGVGSRTQALALVSQEGLLDSRPAPMDAAVAEHRHNLPAPLTSFVGRQRELDEVADLLKLSRLLTLTGPAGTGKTRLALQVAAQLLEDFADGAYLVDLAPLKDSALVADTVARSLGITNATEQSIAAALENYLRNKELLLVLDNFEHVLEAAPLVSDLLSAAPNLRILATSREALSLYGEQEYPVPPLGVPDLSGPVLSSALTDHGAVALFIQRAQAAKPDFTLTDKDSPVVAEICVRLDGLPLAIELAAAQVKLFSPHALLSQLDSRFTALDDGPRGVPERQRTLRGAIDWSYELLDDAEKVLFARLSVFQGGHTIDAMGAVSGHELPINVLDGLASLLNKNLLRLEEGPEGEPRFTMLETLHEYARQRLQESGEAEDTQRRHAEYFTTLAEQAEPYTRGGGDQMRWLRRLEAEHDNLRAMYKWSMESGAVELRLRLVGALGYFWWRQGHYAEGKLWTELALEAIEGAPPAVRARVYSTAGRVFFYLGDAAAGKRALGEALALYKELGSRRDMGWALIQLSMPSAGRRDEYEEGRAICEDGLALLREVSDKPGIAQALTNLGEQARLHGDLSRAVEAHKESLNVAREIGDKLREAIGLINIGLIDQHEGDAERAQALFKQSLTLAVEIRHLVLKVDAVAYLAGAVGESGYLKLAARLFGAAEGLYDAYGFNMQSADLPEWERSKASVREQLGRITFETAWLEGQAMSLDEAIAYALEEPTSG